MAGRPIILTVFSDADEQNPLPRLRQEREAIKKILRDLDAMEVLEHKILTLVSGDQLLQDIRAYRDRIEVFHYAGHAEEQEILLADGRTLIRGIADMFKNLSAITVPLKLVFINGCATWEQVTPFFDIGVNAVLATRARIQDATAKEFATYFYETLYEKKGTLHQAYNDAIAGINRPPGEIQIVQEPYRGPTNKKLKEARESGNQPPWFLFVQSEDILLQKIYPQQKKSAISFGNETIQKRRAEDLVTQKDKIEKLEEEIENLKIDITEQKEDIRAEREDMESDPGDNQERALRKLRRMEKNLEEDEIRMLELTEEMSFLKEEIKDNEAAFVHSEALKDLRTALFGINFQKQKQYFSTQVNLNNTFHALILQGNKDCAVDLLFDLLLKKLSFYDKVNTHKMELDFSLKGNTAPNESNIWNKVKQHFEISPGLDEQNTTRELVNNYLKSGNLIFYFKRLYNNEAQLNFNIIKKFWYSFHKHATEEIPSTSYSRYKCFLFISDENCRSQDAEPHVLDRGYQAIIPAEDRNKYLLHIMDPPIQPIAFEDLYEWVFDVPLYYQFNSEQEIKNILGGNYGYILPTIKNYCNEIYHKKGREGKLLYDQYFAKYEINQQP